jgi:hypothetical protein
MLVGTAAVVANAFDDQQIVKVDLLVDGELRLVDTVAPYEFAWDTTRELGGPHTLQLRTIDIAGQVSSSSTRLVQVRNPLPTIQLLSPVRNARVFTGLPYRIRWATGEPVNPVSSVGVEVAADGKTFQPLSGCALLPPSPQECIWNAPGPVSTKTVVRVTATDANGAQASVNSGPIRVQSGTPTLKVAFPSKAAVLGLGSTQSLSWTLGLEPGAPVNVEISRNGGGSWELLAGSARRYTNELRWTVTPPAVLQGQLRVTSLNVPLQDASDVFFTIADPVLQATGPSASTIWEAGARVTVPWTTNLGSYDRLNVRLSTDGGVTFPILLAASVPATDRKVTVTVPAFATASARILIESLSEPAWRAMSTADFRITIP